MPPTLPTWEALRTYPMPSTMVQKMIGPIIILISATNAVPMTASPAASLPKIRPTAVPATTATMTATYSQCVLTFFRFGGSTTVPGRPGGVGVFVIVIDFSCGWGLGWGIPAAVVGEDRQMSVSQRGRPVTNTYIRK